MIRAILETDKVLALLDSEGIIPPVIPIGCNTIEAECIIRGRAALIIGQSGFVADDREAPGDEVNGLMLLICDDDDLSHADAGRLLWAFIDRLGCVSSLK
jgi:hypothetical protein